MDERGERKHKSFSGTTKAEVSKKVTDCIADFDQQAIESDESRKTLRKNLLQRLRVFPFSSVEQTINPLYPQRYFQLSQMDCIAYRYELGERAKAAGRDDTGAVTPAGFTRTLNLADCRALLCQESYGKVERHHRRL